MTRAKKSFRLELTKEQQALILQNTGMEAKELELRDNALRTQTEPKPDEGRGGLCRSGAQQKAHRPLRNRREVQLAEQCERLGRR